MSIEDYISGVGLTYEDPVWVLARKRDLAKYVSHPLRFNDASSKGKGDVAEIMSEEQPRMLAEYEAARVNADGILIVIEEQERKLDTSVSFGYGHSKLGLSEGKIIKVMESVLLYPEAIVRVELIQAVSRLCRFIKRAIDLHRHLPDVVELFPILLVTKLTDRYIYSIMMEVAPGIPLALAWHDIDRSALGLRIIETIEGMAAHGYGFSDFALDNIMYDGATDTFTIIDIKPTDFDRSPRFLNDSIMNIYGQLLG